MSSIGAGVPGVRPLAQVVMRQVLLSENGSQFYPGGIIIAGAVSRDPANVVYPHVLRGGVILGRITSSFKFAPSVIGPLTVDCTGSAQTLTVDPTVAVEIVRRIGATGSVTVQGPVSTDGGTMTSNVCVFSAVNVTTGVITAQYSSGNIAAFKAGSWVCPTDGSEVPRTIITKPDGITVIEVETQINLDVNYGKAGIGGKIDCRSVVNYPAAAQLLFIAWLKVQLRLYGMAYVFNDDFLASLS